MAQTPVKVQEAKHDYLVLKSIRTINTQPSREALAEEEAAWIENLMPIGPAFMPAVSQVGASMTTLTATLQSMQFANIGTVNYQICFTTAGGAQAVNLANSSVVTIAAGATFTTPSMDQWKSERIVIADPDNGYFSWDGTLFYSPGSLATVTVTTSGSAYTSTPTVGFTGGGGSGASAVATLSGTGISAITITAVGSGFTAAPTVTFTGGTTATAGLATASAYIMPTGQEGSAVAVYSGRVWIGNGRTLNYTAPNTWYNTSTSDAAGSTTITEGFLRNEIKGLEALDNYLYVFGDSSIFIVGDLKVTGSITTFSFTNLTSTTGTTLPRTITSLERSIVFMNKYGVYAVFGASVQKISKPLDGIFPDINFDDDVSAGLVQIHNILCYAVNFTYQDENATRAIQAVYFDGKWFLTSQGSSIIFVSPAELDGELNLFCTSGTDLRRMYSDSTQTIATTLQTGLYSLGNPIFDKQLSRAGLEYTAQGLTEFTLQVDTEDNSARLGGTASSQIIWLNNNGQSIQWINTATSTIAWYSTGFDTFSKSGPLTGKYLGATVECNAAGFTINGVLFEYIPRASWGP